MDSLSELHLFAGIGGGILGGKLLGNRCVGAVEISSYCREVLRSRQCDGSLEPFPIFEDVRTFPRADFVDKVDVVCGGFPCTDLSIVKQDAKGLDGPSSSLWFAMRDVVRDVRPRYVFVENVPALALRGLDRVLADLAGLGFDAEWSTLSSGALDAEHYRDRLWLLASHPERARPSERAGEDGERAYAAATRSGWRAPLPGVRRSPPGVPGRVDRIRALGNAQDPYAAAVAFLCLRARLEGRPALDC